MANDAELWFESREGKYFCKQCDQALVGVTMREAAVLDAPVEGAHYHCERSDKNVVLPSPG